MKVVSGFKQFIDNLHPVKIVTLGYLSYIIIGWLILSIPFTHSMPVKTIDSLFIATSAVSTTGLVTISIADNYNILGELIILILIQIGGLGYMTFGSFVILSRKKELTPDRTKISNAVFSLPKNFKIHKFIKSVIKFTLIFEFIGAIILFFIFKSSHSPQPLWSAIFHSVSAFCTAGFSIYNNSFESLYNNFWLNFVISILSYAGAIGFIVFVDIWRKLNGKIKNITLTSHIILHATFWLSIIGTINIFLVEPSVSHLPADQRILTSFFQTMTALTTVGFNTISISGIAKSTMLVITILMIIGASPSGTGGGLKSTTFTAMIGVMKSVLKGSSKVTFWRQEIPFERVWTAIASLCFYVAVLLLGTYLLTLTETINLEELFFESASALGTVGLSMGITADLTNLGKILITILMLIGRLGPLTFGMALFIQDEFIVNEDERDLAI